MKKYTALAILALPLLGGCGDNAAEGVYPAEGVERTLRLLDAPAGGSAVGSTMALASANGQVTLTVESDTRWKAEVLECEGQWCSLLDAVGNGNGQFTIVPADNPSASGRECLLMLTATDRDGNSLAFESITVRLTQEGRELNVLPLNVEKVSYLGFEGLAFTVTTNQPWLLDCNQWAGSGGFVTLASQSGMTPGNDGRWSGSGNGSFKIDIARNMGQERGARLSLSSPTGAFLPINIDIVQAAPTETFAVSGPNIAPAEGGTLTWTLLSSVNGWEAVSVCDWITFDTAKGAASDSPVTVTAKAQPNNSGATRTGDVVFRCNGNDRPFTLVQGASGDVRPTFSLPWVTDGWTYSAAEICCNFISTDYDVEECGIEIALAGSGSWTAYPCGDNGSWNAKGGRITASIAGLKGMTRYEVRGWAVWRAGDELSRGTSAAITFETPNAWPSVDDNLPPLP